MLHRFNNPFKVKQEDEEEGHDRLCFDVGLQIVIHSSQRINKSNVVVKSSLKGIKSSISRSKATHNHDDLCFLKFCHLCNKKLSFDKDVFMYRGNQGFCSIECRDRQIVLDDIKELEISTKRMIASYRHCNQSGQMESRFLLEDLRRRRDKPPSHPVQWAILS